MKRSAGAWLFDGTNAVILIVLCVLTLYPFVYVILASLSDPFRMMQHTGPLLSPLGFTLVAYERVFANPNIGSGYANTVFVVVVGTAVNLLLTSLGAYGLSRKRLFFRNALMFGIAFTMLFNGGLIPTYLLVRSLGLIDTRWALVFPRAMDAFFLIIMRTYFQGMPDSLEESAKLDGAGDLTVLVRIYLPLALPVVAVMILFYGVKNWNTWFQPMIYLRTRSLFPLQLILREILITNETMSMSTAAATSDKEAVGETIKYATIMVATVPILVVYPLLQKYFVKGVMIGALKE